MMEQLSAYKSCILYSFFEIMETIILLDHHIQEALSKTKIGTISTSGVQDKR